MIKKRFFENFIKSSGHMLHHMLIVGLSAGLALALPLGVRVFWKEFLIYRSLIRSDKIFLTSVEMILGILVIFVFAYIRRNWNDRKLSNMARAAGMVLVTPAKGFFAKRRIRKLKESQGTARGS